jgi:hypothetical protein
MRARTLHIREHETTVSDCSKDIAGVGRHNGVFALKVVNAIALFPGSASQCDVTRYNAHVPRKNHSRKNSPQTSQESGTHGYRTALGWGRERD